MEISEIKSYFLTLSATERSGLVRELQDMAETDAPAGVFLFSSMGHPRKICQRSGSEFSDSHPFLE